MPSTPQPLNCNLAALRALLEAEQRPVGGGTAAQWELGRIGELPEIEILAEQLGLCRPGELSGATVKAIVARLCVNCSIDQQEAYRLPLSRVVPLLRELTNHEEKASQKEATMPDAKNVFVIHGRNLAARNGMFDFLRAAGLSPIEWGEAIKMTGKSSPYIGDVLDSAFANAQAVVALFRLCTFFIPRGRLNVQRRE